MKYPEQGGDLGMTVESVTIQRRRHCI